MDEFRELISSQYSKAEIAAMLAEIMDSLGLDEQDLPDLFDRAFS